MATDKSEPRTRLIFTIGAFAILVLLATHAALVSYFADMAKDEQYRKIGSLKPEALVSVRADEKVRLGSGPMPIDKAMQQMVAQGRMAASPDIMPSASRDVAPLQGWSKIPGDVPIAMTEPLPAPSATVALGGDAGLDAAADASARPRTPDGGPPRRP